MAETILNADSTSSELEHMVRRIRSASGCVRIAHILERELNSLEHAKERIDILSLLLSKFDEFASEELESQPPLIAETRRLIECYITVLQLRSSQYSESGIDIEAGEKDARDAVDWCRLLESPIMRSAALNHLGNNLMIQQRYEEGRLAFLDALALEEEAGDQSSIVRTLYNIARAETSLGDPSRALEIANRALAIYEKDTSGTLPLFGKSLLLNLRVDIQVHHDDPGQALIDATANLEILRSLGARDKLASTHLSLVRLNLLIDDVTAAMDHAIQMVPNDGAQADIMDRLYQFAALAAVHIRLGDIDKACECCLEGIRLARENNCSAPEALLLERYAEAHRVKGDLPGAESLLREALSKEFGASKRAGLWTSLANVTLDRGNLSVAAECLEEAMDIIGPRRRNQELSTVLITRARLLEKAGMPIKAIETLKEVLENDKGFINARMEALERLAGLYESVGDTGSALNHFRQYHTMAVAKKQANADSRLTAMRTSFETTTLHKELKSARQEADHLRAKVNRQALDLVALQKLHDDTQQELRDAISRLNREQQEQPETVEHLRSVLARLDTQEKVDDRVLDLMRGVDEQFYVRLRKRFPTLTPNQERFCALIRTGLSSSEIAKVLHISNETVMTQRKRLRRRMELTPNDNLEKVVAEI